MDREESAIPCPFLVKKCRCNRAKCTATNPHKRILDMTICRSKRRFTKECDAYKRKMLEVQEML